MKGAAIATSGAIAVALCGCGGGTKTVLSTTTATTTVVTTTAAIPTTPTAAPRIPQLTPCGEIATNNCDFAQAVVAAFRSSWAASGMPPSSLKVRTNPLACSVTAGGQFYCRSLVSSVALEFRMQQPSAPATTSSSPTSSSPTSAEQTFTGNGAKNLGTITVRSDSTIHWTNDGALFSVIDLGINSQAHSGTSALSAGTYRNVEVNALGNWTMKIVPGP
jgi:hypothetical protein